jgi:hypothetical protein
MSPIDRLSRWRLQVIAARVLGVMCWSLAVALVVLLVGRLAGASTVWPALGVAALTATALLHPLRRRLDPRALALWLERQVPALRYALVTRLDTPDGPFLPTLDAAIAEVPFEALTRRTLWRPLLPAAATAAVLVAGLLVVPLRGGGAGASSTVGTTAIARTTARSRDALSSYRVTVTAPAYSGQPAVILDQPARVPAIVGSRLQISGPGGSAPVVVAMGAESLLVDSTAGNGWRVETSVGESPVPITLTSGARERTLLVEPVADSLPAVTLRTPARDSVLRTGVGSVALAAEWRDDFGVRDSWFDVVISSGEGESFTFRTLVVGRVMAGSRRSGSSGARLSLDSLKLAPGDLVSIRAVARDAGPPRRGMGTSDTRTLRIARAGEYDSVAVEGAPPPDPLKGLFSQRLIIQQTEALIRRMGRIDAATLQAESRRIGRDQGALRRQVGDIVFQRLEDTGGGGEHSHDDGHDHGGMTPEQLLKEASEATSHTGEALDFAGGESPVVAINRPLLEAYNAMWDAGTSLNIGEPRRALPHMYVALAAIQRARAAERVYLRGRPRDIIVDIAKVRLAGTLKDLGPDRRTPRDDRTTVERQRLARFDAAVALLPQAPDRALTALLLLRAELLGTADGAAAALAEAVDALRGPVDATNALLAARRALDGRRRPTSSVQGWSVLP